MQFRLTDEQVALRDLATQGGSLKVKAYAGASKTTSLEVIAGAHPATRALYLAFNKPIAEEAKARMPPKVTARTNHSLAYGAMRPNAERLGTRLSGRFIAETFKLSGIIIGINKQITSAQLGSIALTTVANFCNSADTAITVKHVPSMAAVFQVVPPEIKADKAGWREVEHIALTTAQKIWTEQQGDSFPITHDTYLKQWALRRPVIRTDLILFDEAQDASPVMLDVLTAQQVPIIWVGDPYQQIYGWRGAVDAMEKITTDNEGRLTRSFRFGANIASKANLLLRQLGETQPLIGAGDGKTKNGSEAFLSRTNAAAIGAFMKQSKKRPHAHIELVGGTDMLRIVNDLQSLMNGRATGAFHLFNDYGELKEYANSDSGRDMAALVRAVDEFGISKLEKNLRNASEKSSRAADITISTVHKAKGREWDYVKIAGDFMTNEEGAVIESPEENRLLYVAITRARVELDHDEINPWLSAMEEAQASKTPAKN